MIDDYNFTEYVLHSDIRLRIHCKKSDTSLCKVTNSIPHIISPGLSKFDIRRKFNFS